MPDHANDNDIGPGEAPSCIVNEHISDAENARRILAKFSKFVDDLIAND